MFYCVSDKNGNGGRKEGCCADIAQRLTLECHAERVSIVRSVQKLQIALNFGGKSLKEGL